MFGGLSEETYGRKHGHTRNVLEAFPKLFLAEKVHKNSRQNWNFWAISAETNKSPGKTL